MIVDEAATSSVPVSSWEIIRTHPDDPRTIRAALNALATDSNSGGCKSYEQLHETGEPILAAHPTSDDASLEAIVRIVGGCPDRRALKWTTRPAADVVAAMRKDVVNNYRMRPELALPLLLELGPTVDQSVVDVVVASVGAEPGLADAYVKAGLPPNGTKLGPAEAGPHVDPKTDPRMTPAFFYWLNTVYAGPNETDAAAMLRVLEWITPPALTEQAGDTIGANLRVAGVMKLCQALVRPESKPFIEKHATPTQSVECFAALGTVADAQKLLTSLEDRADFAAGAITEKERGKAWADEQAAILVKMGPKIAPVLSRALSDPKLSARAMAARAFVKIDRHAYALAAARALRVGAPTNGFDAELAMSLAAGEPLELDVYFAALGTDTDSSASAVTALKTSVKPQVWVPPFFANLAVGTQFRTQVVDRFVWLLSETEGVQVPVAAVLESELALTGGKPEQIYWLKKMVALRALEAKGTSTA